MDSFETSVTDWLCERVPEAPVYRQAPAVKNYCVEHGAWHGSIQRFADILQPFWSHACCLAMTPAIIERVPIVWSMVHAMDRSKGLQTFL